MRDKKGTHRFWGVLFYLALMVTIVSVRSGDKKRAAGKRKK